MDKTALTVMHLDMDAFFAAIEQRDHPELRGKPVVVGSPPDKRGVVSTASYEARKFGIHSAMPSRTAGKKCPHAIFVPVNGKHYHDVSVHLMSILREFTPIIEQLSVDEAFLDIRSVMRIWKDPIKLADAVRQRIRDELHLTGSVGLARNKFLAKLASDMEKPDGLTVVPTDDEEVIRFLAPLPVNRIWGIGKKGSKYLAELGLHKIADLQAMSLEESCALLGEAMGDHVWHLARGLDDREVETEWEEKSISGEYTFDQDCAETDAVRQVLLEQVERAGRRVRESGNLARRAHIKVRFSDFKTITRQRALPYPTASDRDLAASARELFEKEQIDQPVRLIGFGVSDFVEPSSPEAVYQPSLFDTIDRTQNRERNQNLDRAVDEVRSKYGRAAIRRGDWKARE